MWVSLGSRCREPTGISSSTGKHQTGTRLIITWRSTYRVACLLASLKRDLVPLLSDGVGAGGGPAQAAGSASARKEELRQEGDEDA
eukprot:45752-Eustigmatos_ZCMA.PRE.1